MTEEQQKNVLDKVCKKSTSYKLHNFIKGAKAGIPIAIGYIPIPIAIAFGLLSRSSGIPVVSQTRHFQ